MLRDNLVGKCQKERARERLVEIATEIAAKQENAFQPPKTSIMFTNNSTKEKKSSNLFGWMVTTTQNKHIKCVWWVNDTHDICVCVRRLKLKYFIRKQIETFSEMRQKSLECHSQDQEYFFFPLTEILSIELIAIIIIVVLLFVGIQLSGVEPRENVWSADQLPKIEITIKKYPNKIKISY